MGPLEAEWGLPDMVQHYHSLYPLEDITGARERPSPAFGLATALFKAVSAKDGQGYTLRRLDPRKVLTLQRGLASCCLCMLMDGLAWPSLSRRGLLVGH